MSRSFHWRPANPPTYEGTIGLAMWEALILSIDGNINTDYNRISLPSDPWRRGWLAGVRDSSAPSSYLHRDAVNLLEAFEAHGEIEIVVER